MSTTQLPTSDRLYHILCNFIPDTVTFVGRDLKAYNSMPVVEFSVKVKIARHELPNDDPLQAALGHHIKYVYDSIAKRYTVVNTVDGLYGIIVSQVISEYKRWSKRCAATQRKTEKFIDSITLNSDNKLMQNFLLGVYIKIHSEEYTKLSRESRESFFDTFESLRKTYGKR